MEFQSSMYQTEADIIRTYELTEEEQVYLLPELMDVEQALFSYLMML